MKASFDRPDIMSTSIVPPLFDHCQANGIPRLDFSVGHGNIHCNALRSFAVDE